MAQIGLNISVTGLSGFLIIRWVRPTAPLAEVGRSDAFAFPYDNVYVIHDLAPVVYTVQLWRSDDGIALDQLIKDWSVDASKESITTVKTYQYLVGRGDSGTDPDWADPENEDVILNDQRLDGFEKTDLIVHEAGYGNKLDSEYDLVSGGGIELLNGKTFDEGVAWFITTISNQLVTIPPTTTGAIKYSGVITIDENEEFDEDLQNKLVLVNSESQVITVNFPDLTLIPDDTHVTFQTHSGSQNYLKLQFDSGDTVWFNNKQANVIYIAKCEKISLYFKDGVGVVDDYDGNAAKRGSVTYDYDSNRNTDNGNLLYADESTGELEKDDYPGLYEFVEQLSGTSVCPLGTGVGQWSYDSGGGVFPNKVKFGIDTVSERIRVPHLSGLVAKMSSTPGVYEPDAVGPHNITLPAGRYVYGNEGRGNLGDNATNNAVRRADSNRWNSNDVTTGSSETKVKSYSQKPFIYL